MVETLTNIKDLLFCCVCVCVYTQHVYDRIYMVIDIEFCGFV